MDNIKELTKEEQKDAIKELYSSFPTGRDFEVFLNYFLQKIGFEEVVTTKYIGDNGIDLICVKKGLDNTGIDTLNYYVQAKRYAYSNKITASDIRDLKGATKRDKNGNILTCNFINVFITTSSFTSGAIEEAESNLHNPTILIDGERLLNLCIDNQIGFTYKPIFSKIQIKEILSQFTSTNNNINTERKVATDFDASKIITVNDIRARILPIPTVIRNKLDNGVNSVDVIINGINKHLNINKTRRFLAGITDIYKQYGLITADNEYISKNSKWKIQDNKIIIEID